MLFRSWILVLVLLVSSHPVWAAPLKVAQNAPPPAPASPPLNILSIIPAQAEPGMVVTISGDGFTRGTTAFLATTEIPVTLVGPRQLSFQIPDLPAGLYALFLRNETGATSRTYSFTISSPKPVATDLSPDLIFACTPLSEREAIISGKNFRQGAQVIFDGAAIRSRLVSPEAVSFVVPQVAGGLHQVQVRNADGSASGVLGLMIDAKPEITGITVADQSVNFYNLIIEGRNFQQSTVLVVSEERSLELVGQEHGLDVKRLATGMNSGGIERERVIYQNCNRLVYQRYPYSTVTKNFSLQVVNPDGSESSAYAVSAP